MNSVDTGWVSDEDPADIAAREDHGAAFFTRRSTIVGRRRPDRGTRSSPGSTPAITRGVSSEDTTLRSGDPPDARCSTSRKASGAWRRRCRSVVRDEQRHTRRARVRGSSRPATASAYRLSAGRPRLHRDRARIRRKIQERLRRKSDPAVRLKYAGTAARRRILHPALAPNARLVRVNVLP